MADKQFVVYAIILISLYQSAIGQQGTPELGFTNKKEAKNRVVNRLKEGKWVEYWQNAYNTSRKDTNAPYFTLTIYKAGVPTGIKRCYHRNRRLAWEVPYVNGKRNGILKEYYENGKIEYEAPYTNDRINGIAKQYYQSGQVDIEAPYINDTINGKQTEYFEDGKVMREIFFTKGKQGDTRMYGEDGIEVK